MPVDRHVMAARLQEIEREMREAEWAGKSDGGNGKDTTPPFDWTEWERGTEATHWPQAAESAAAPLEPEAGFTLGIDEIVPAADAPEPQGEPTQPSPAETPQEKKKAGKGLHEKTGEALKRLAPVPEKAKGAPFLWLPKLLVDSGLMGLLERRGLGWLLVVLIFFGDMKDGTVSATIRRLCDLTGTAKRATLTARLRTLCRKMKLAGGRELPALLVRVGMTAGRSTMHYRFSDRGLEAMMTLAAGMAAERRAAHNARRDAIHEARAQAGRKGMRSRWGKQRITKRPAAGTFVTNPLQAKGENNK